MIALNGKTALDAADIREFRDSRNNDPRNRIALCKNAHWTFDQGLWTISDDYRVIVAVGPFTEAGPTQVDLLKGHHGRRLNLREDKSLWPGAVHLTWHRKSKLAVA
jgi:putative restriction endonuclease